MGRGHDACEKWEEIHVGVIESWLWRKEIRNQLRTPEDHGYSIYQLYNIQEEAFQMYSESKRPALKRDQVNRDERQ